MATPLEVFKIKQGDRRPYIFSTLAPRLASGKAGTPVNLSDAEEVVFNMKNKAGDVILSRRPCEIDDAAAGDVHYEWAAGDTEQTPGDYFGEFAVVWPNEEEQTFPNDKLGFTIRITIDIA